MITFQQAKAFIKKVERVWSSGTPYEDEAKVGIYLMKLGLWAEENGVPQLLTDLHDRLDGYDESGYLSNAVSLAQSTVPSNPVADRMEQRL